MKGAIIPRSNGQESDEEYEAEVVEDNPNGN